MPRSEERLITTRFVLVVFVGFLYFLSLGTLVPAVPKFVEKGLLGGSLAVGIAVGAFSVGSVLVRPFAGRIGDRLGRKVLIVGGAFVVGVSVALYHLVGSVPALVLARLLGGVGEAAFFVGAGTMATDLAPESRRGEAISYWSVAVYGGLAFGPMVGEVLIQDGSFGGAWIVTSALALVAAALGLVTTETMPPRERADGAGGEAVRVHQPLLHRAALAPGLVLFLGMVPLAGFFGFVPLYVDGIGLRDSRNVFLLYGVLILILRIAGARVHDRAGPLLAGSCATGFAAAGMLIVAAVPNPVGLYAGTVVFALGMSLLYPSMLTLALTGVSPRERGSAVGTVSSFFDASQGLGAAALGGVAALAGFGGAFVGGALFACTGFVLLRAGIDPRLRRPADDAEVVEAARAALEYADPEPPP